MIKLLLRALAVMLALVSIFSATVMFSFVCLFIVFRDVGTLMFVAGALIVFLATGIGVDKLWLKSYDY